MSAPAWIACDWGATACRAWAMSADDRPMGARREGPGAASLAPDAFETAFVELAGDWLGDGPVPVVICGAAGEREGWAEVPCRPVPATPLGGMLPPTACRDGRIDLRIVPGLSQSRPPDMLHGEETQIAGFLTVNPDFDGVICLPGSHSRWARISAGEVVSFQSAMTGALFGLLSEQSVLRHTLGRAWSEAAFLEAASDALSRPQVVAARLFSLRAGALLDPDAAGHGRARLSGYLIGAELAASRAYWLGMDIAIIADRALGDCYAAALGAEGVPVTRTRADDLTLRGLAAARRQGTDR